MTRPLLLALCLPPLCAGHSRVATLFDTHFVADKTMRVDYFHTGGRGQELFALDRVVSDGPWPGSRSRLIDDSNLGKYLFEVIDRTSNQVVYSRGFASLYGEWETTPQAGRLHRTFHESVRFPWPRRPVQLVAKKRDRENSFHEVWSTVIDPGSRFVNPADVERHGEVLPLVESGPAERKVDLLIIGDGYTAAERAKFRGDASRLTDALFAVEPYTSRKTDFNVRLLHLPSERSGVHLPQANSPRRTSISTEYNIFDSERYLLTQDNRTLRDRASAVPYDFVEILVNEAYYGGGGIFGDHATSSVDSAFSDYVFIHEFAHHFAGLADEYYTSDVAYTTGAPEHPEPWEPNITALHDPSALKWRDLVEPDTPVPTPWEKEAFEKHSREIQARRRALRAKAAPEREMDALFREQQAWETKFLASMKYSRKVGAFEGAGYEARGLYRPEADCIMFTRDKVGFCRVCRRAIERIIDLYSRP